MKDVSKKKIVMAAVALRNLVTAGSPVAMTLLRDPQAMVSFASETYFLHNTMNGRRHLPQKPVHEVLPVNDPQKLVLGGLADSLNWFGPVPSYTADLIALCLMVRAVDARVVFEIGTLTGYTAFQFALNTSPDAVVYTLDLPASAAVRPHLATTFVDDAHIHQHRDTGYVFQGSPVESKIRCLHGDSATFDFTPYQGKVDLFFIDGAHSYEYVRSDTTKALQSCHGGSVIAWHDYGRMGVNGVSRWLRELSKLYKIYSVPGGSVAYTVVPSE